jgi:hypothetical protein
LTTNDRTFVHAAAVCASALALLCAACDQPAPKCNVAHGPFWAKYTLVSGEGDCAMLTGEELDVQSYYAPRSPSDKRPDFDKVSVAIQPFAITAALANAAGLAEPEADDVPYAIGRFVTTSPRSDQFCVAPKLAAAQLRLPAVPAHDVDMCTSVPDAPAYDVRYEFSNLRVYYTPAAIGTQFAADLTYTADGCTARYTVAAVYPMVSCGVPTPLEDAGVVDAASELDAAADDAEVLDASEPADAAAADGGAAEDAGEACPPPEPPSGPPVPDDSSCENVGINPDFAVACDPDTLMCALKKGVPSLR